MKTKKYPTSSEENVIKSLLGYILYEQTFCSFNLLSFYKPPIFSCVLALIYLKGVFESRVAEAPVQHSQRSPSLRSSALVPFRRQSFFAQVNQSLEKDSLTIRSALRVQRAHSATNLMAERSKHLPNLLKDKSITKSILCGASQQRWKEIDFNRAKTEHKRWQEEERQQKRKQQQEADGIRHQLHGDSQR